MESMPSKRYCFAIDLVNDPAMIAEYEWYHAKENMSAQIINGIRAVGIIRMDIFRTGNRLMMLIETAQQFDVEADFKRMLQLPGQAEWASLMSKFQQKITSPGDNGHWALMKQVFDLNA